MFKKIDERFEYLLSLMRKNEADLEIITKAYEMAKSMHFDQKRKDGTPYLSHPVEVAIILAELGFDEDCVCACLLHDTIEDCGYTKEQMQQDFNKNIAEMVDAVSAIDKTKYIYDKQELYEDPNFIKSSVEEQTFKKLISLGKKNTYGFYIKFADRLHNLSTISTFPYFKQLEKVRETEKWVLPVAKALKAEYFYIAIKNECFKIVNKENGQNYFEQYDSYHISNAKQIENVMISLKKLFKDESIKDIIYDKLSERKVFDELKLLNKKIKIKDISQGQIINVPNYVIYIIYQNGMQRAVANNLVLAKLNKNISNFKVVDAKIGSFSELPYYVIRDEYKNYYRFYVLSIAEYKKLRIGAIDGSYNEKIDEENLNNMERDIIRVKTRSGEVKRMPKYSTALDFAFKIHKDIGFAFKYAIINGGKTEFPPYTKLNENDKVEIIVDKNENGELKNNAKLRWLAYVNTELAKKVLVRYFEMLSKFD